MHCSQAHLAKLILGQGRQQLQGAGQRLAPLSRMKSSLESNVFTPGQPLESCSTGLPARSPAAVQAWVTRLPFSAGNLPDYDFQITEESQTFRRYLTLYNRRIRFPAHHNTPVWCAQKPRLFQQHCKASSAIFCHIWMNTSQGHKAHPACTSDLFRRESMSMTSSAIPS